MRTPSSPYRRTAFIAAKRIRVLVSSKEITSFESGPLSAFIKDLGQRLADKSLCQIIKEIYFAAGHSGPARKESGYSNGRKQAEHVKLMNFIRDELNGNRNWRKGNGRPRAEADIRAYLLEHPDASKAAVIRGTGKDKKTVYKYYEAAKRDAEMQLDCSADKV